MNTVRIIPDRYPSNPRDNDNICLMACAHGRYDLGDDNAKFVLAEKLEVSQHNHSLQELVEMADNKGLIFAMKPLYMYDHGGQTVATTPFSCSFDSGQIGVVIIFKETIKQEFGVKRFGKNIITKMTERANLIIEAEVKEYDAYISGNYYSLEIIDSDGEVEETISGFIGYNAAENGMLECVSNEMREHVLNAVPEYA